MKRRVGVPTAPPQPPPTLTRLARAWTWLLGRQAMLPMQRGERPAAADDAGAPLPLALDGAGTLLQLPTLPAPASRTPPAAAPGATLAHTVPPHADPLTPPEMPSPTSKRAPEAAPAAEPGAVLEAAPPDPPPTLPLSYGRLRSQFITVPLAPSTPALPPVTAPLPRRVPARRVPLARSFPPLSAPQRAKRGVPWRVASRVGRAVWSAVWARRLTLALWSAGVLLALVAPYLLTTLGVTRQLRDELVALGFDDERAQMLTAFGLALLGAGLAGLLALRRSAAWLGSVLAFALTYLWPFSQQAVHPLAGADGQLQVVLDGRLAHVLLTLLALAVLCAAAGAVLGEACGRLVLPPLVSLGAHLLRMLRRSPASAAALPPRAIARALSATGLVALALGLALPDAGALLSFGASDTIYPTQQVPPAQRGTVEQGTYSSPALEGVARGFRIYLPPSYFTAAAQAQRYPVIYLLHGSPGGPADWFSAAHASATADALLADDRAREAILVAPDGNGSLYRVSAWANSFDKRQRMEDSIATDLVAYLDSHYRTLADAADRAIGGLSEGGYGAINIALHRPDVFSKVMSLSGYYQASGSAVFGRGPASVGHRQYNSPLAYLQSPEGQRAAHRLTFIIGVGNQDTDYFTASMAFAKALGALGISVHLLLTDGGHSWVVWSQQFGQSLPLLAPLRQPQPAQRLRRDRLSLRTQVLDL